MSGISPYSIMLSSGKYFDFANPRPEDFTLDDLVTGLSNLNRFNSQTYLPYSVAQHSVLVSLFVPKECALAALLHDGSEAFMGDIATPLKRLLPDYKLIEERVQGVIHEFFGLPERLDKEMTEHIKKADLALFVTERFQLMPDDGKVWPGIEGDPLPIDIRPMDASLARHYFLSRLSSILEDRDFFDFDPGFNGQEKDLFNKRQSASF